MPESSPFSLRGPVDPAPFLPRAEWPPWLWFAAAAAVLLVAFGIVALLRSRRPATPDPRKLRNVCREAVIRELDAIDPTLLPTAVATGVSLALRRYLAAVCGDPALFESHEETLARGAVPAALPAETRVELARVFASLASIKYAHDAPAPAVDIVAAARALVDRIHAALSSA